MITCAKHTGTYLYPTVSLYIVEGAPVSTAIVGQSPLPFVAKEMDDNGFVIDFGDLHFLRDWIDDNLDHATALKVDDPMRVECEQLQQQGLLKILWVQSASCEGIAQFLYHTFQPMIEQKTNGRVRIQSLHLEEDAKKFCNLFSR